MCDGGGEGRGILGPIPMHDIIAMLAIPAPSPPTYFLFREMIRKLIMCLRKHLMIHMIPPNKLKVHFPTITQSSLT